jgi:regulator of protease activity HflC (stomatin/prohibitin superfamily)
MPIKALLGVLIAILVIGGIGGGLLYTARSSSQPTHRSRPGIILIAVGVIGAVILLPLNAGLVLIQPNEVGVVFRQTAPSDRSLLTPLQPGLKWVVPFIDKVTKYNAGQRSVTMASSEENLGATQGAVRAISSDGQVINVDVTIIYQINREEINNIHRNWPGEIYEDNYIIPQTRSEVRNAISNYGAEEIYSGGRVALEAEIVDGLREKFSSEGFLLSEVLIRNISFSPEFTDAIEQKQIAQQNAQRAAFLVQQAEQEADQARAEARGRADSAVIAADGEAQGILIRANAEAEALDLINQVLSQNPNLIQWQYVNELGDNVQMIILPSNSPFLFDLQQLVDQGQAEVVPTPLPAPAPAPEEGEQ